MRQGIAGQLVCPAGLLQGDHNRRCGDQVALRGQLFSTQLAVFWCTQDTVATQVEPELFALIFVVSYFGKTVDSPTVD